MAITRWNPFQEMYTMQNRLNSLLQEMNRSEDETFFSSAFVPPVDIYEDANHVVLKLEVPGMKLEDFDVQMENQTLTVRGERKFEKETKEENYHRVERRYGSFARVFSLPNSIDPESVKANYEAGVLTMELGKRAEAKPKQIKISVSGAHQGEAARKLSIGENKPAA
ncbi:MAG: Hsp20/alpha crystallin family protein [Acidobacteriaceae bacterium]